MSSICYLDLKKKSLCMLTHTHFHTFTTITSKNFAASPEGPAPLQDAREPSPAPAHCPKKNGNRCTLYNQ